MATKKASVRATKRTPRRSVLSDEIYDKIKAMILDHEIAPGSRVAGWCGVTHSITEPGDYMGNPAIKAGQWRRLQVRLKQISEDRAAGRKATRK